MFELTFATLLLAAGGATGVQDTGTGAVDAAAVVEISPEQALERQRAGALLVDVREDDERAAGFAAGALGVPMDELMAHPARHLPDPAAEILLICRSGQRSRRVADSLIRQGYTRVVSVAGGTLRWNADGLSMQRPDPGVPQDTP